MINVDLVEVLGIWEVVFVFEDVENEILIFVKFELNRYNDIEGII